METNERNLIIFVFCTLAAVLLLMEWQIMHYLDLQCQFNDEVIKRFREIGAIK